MRKEKGNWILTKEEMNDVIFCLEFCIAGNDKEIIKCADKIRSNFIEELGKK